MWWLLTIPAAYVLKKTYDSISEPTPSEKTLNNVSRDKAQKSLRFNARKTAVSEILIKRRQQTFAQIQVIIKPIEAGELSIVTLKSGRCVMNFTDINTSLRKLQSALSILDPDIRQRCIHNPLLNLAPIAHAVDQIVEKADEEYGDLAGIDSSGVYSEQNDPFLEHLRNGRC